MFSVCIVENLYKHKIYLQFKIQSVHIKNNLHKKKNWTLNNTVSAIYIQWDNFI